MRLTHATNNAIKYACKNFHYAKAVPVNILGYNVYNDNDEWCGCVIFGTGANNNIENEYKLAQGQVLELVRVALNGKQSCTSQVVAKALKELHKDCPLCRLVVSYADCDQEHLGTIYQATNWYYVGTMMQGAHDSSWVIRGKRYHGRIISDWVRNRGGLQGLTRKEFLQKYYDPNAKPYVTQGKRKYLMPMDKAMRKQIVPLAKPYPKNDDWVKIDRTKFKEEMTDGE